MRNPEQIKAPTNLRIGLKILLALVLLWILLTLWAVMLFSVGESAWEEDEAQLVRWCDSNYYDRDLPALFESLILYDLYSPTYDRYWEAVALAQARVSLAQARLEEEANLPEAGDHLREAQARWDTLAASPAFFENAGIVSYLTERLPE